VAKKGFILTPCLDWPYFLATVRLLRQSSHHVARYKDSTFETLNKSDFLSLIQEAFPAVNWEKAYEDFRAAGEKKE
jgi:hypothetical protein